MDSRKKIGLAAVGAALLATGAVLYAQESGLRGPMASFDTDGNGAITLAEARTGAATMFAGADADKDGRVTHEEMRAFHDKMGGRHRGGGPHGGHGGSGKPAMGPPPGGPMHLDADGDGAITVAEAQGGIERHFGEIDANRDGSITAAEMEAAHRAHHDKR
jgi:EF hand